MEVGIAGLYVVLRISASNTSDLSTKEACAIITVQTRLNRNDFTFEEKTMGIFRTKKYMTLKDVRVYYDDKTDRIRLTSSDPRIRGGLNMIINPGRKNEIEVRNALVAEGIIQDESFKSPLPTNASIPEDAKDNPFEIPLGVGTKGTIFWTVQEGIETTLYSPHLMVAGIPGSGKTVLSSNVINHCYNHSASWEIVVAGLQDSFRSEIKLIEDKVSVRSSSLVDALVLLKSVESEIILRGVGASHTKRKLVVIEDYGHLLRVSQDENHEGKLALLIIERISHLLRVGRQAGIHLLIESHIADNTLTSLGGMHLPAILVVGRLTVSESIDIFRSDLSIHTRDNIQGRGIIHTKNGLEHIQTFGPVS